MVWLRMTKMCEWNLKLTYKHSLTLKRSNFFIFCFYILLIISVCKVLVWNSIKYLNFSLCIFCCVFSFPIFQYHQQNLKKIPFVARPRHFFFYATQNFLLFFSILFIFVLCYLDFVQNLQRPPKFKVAMLRIFLHDCLVCYVGRCHFLVYNFLLLVLWVVVVTAELRSGSSLNSFILFFISPSAGENDADIYFYFEIAYLHT